MVILDNNMEYEGETAIRSTYKGYIYQPMQGCVMVLNAKNGKYVGRDEKIRTGTLAVGITERYNDLMIFSGICEGIRNVYAIKMDMHTR